MNNQLKVAHNQVTKTRLHKKSFENKRVVIFSSESSYGNNFFWISWLIMPVTTDDFPTEKNMYYFRTLSDFDYYLYIILNNYPTKIWIKNKFIWMLYYWPWNQLLVGLINIIILIYVVATFTNCIRRIQKTYCKNHTCFIKKTSSKEVVITKLYIFIY